MGRLSSITSKFTKRGSGDDAHLSLYGMSGGDDATPTGTLSGGSGSTGPLGSLGSSLGASLGSSLGSVLTSPLRNLNIRNKMLAVALPPILLVVVLALVGINGRLGESSEASRAVDQTTFLKSNSRLANDLRIEMIYSSAYLSAPEGEVAQQWLEPMENARSFTDKSLATYQESLLSVNPGAGDPTIQSNVTRFDERLSNLGLNRAAIDERQIPISQAVSQYSNTLGESDGLTTSIVQSISNPQLVGKLNTAANLSRLQSAIAEEAALLTAVAQRGAFFTPADERCEQVFSTTCNSFSSAQELNARARSALATFEQTSATTGDQRAGRDALTNQDYDELRRRIYQDGREGNALTVLTGEVIESASSQLVAFSRLENQLLSGMQQLAQEIADEAQRGVWLFALAALSAVVIAAAAAIYAAKVTTQPLRRLTEAALVLSNEKIPGLVNRLRDPQREDEQGAAYSRELASSAQLSETFEEISVESRDEVGKLAEAFNAVQRVTVEVAEEQGELLRKGIGDIFVNLARRNQVLLERQIRFIEDMESSEEDPDLLENLFKLDHLATRMRRNAESLLVLAGAETGRSRRGKPVSISDVIRLGMGEAEDFQRVRITQMDSVMVPANLAADLSHLLGELIENATQYSPPDTSVDVDGHLEASGVYYMRVIDRGMGMSLDQMSSSNDLLTNPPLMGLEISRSLGFIVVGRLASRFGIRVSLSPNPDGGTIATIVLPPAALHEREHVAPSTGRPYTQGDSRPERGTQEVSGGRGGVRPALPAASGNVPSQMPPPPQGTAPVSVDAASPQTRLPTSTGVFRGRTSEYKPSGPRPEPAPLPQVSPPPSSVGERSRRTAPSVPVPTSAVPSVPAPSVPVPTGAAASGAVSTSAAQMLPPVGEPVQRRGADPARVEGQRMPPTAPPPHTPKPLGAVAASPSQSIPVPEALPLQVPDVVQGEAAPVLKKRASRAPAPTGAPIIRDRASMPPPTGAPMGMRGDSSGSVPGQFDAHTGDTSRSPDQIQQMLSRYRDGITEGRYVKGGTSGAAPPPMGAPVSVVEDPPGAVPSAPPPTGVPVESSSVLKKRTPKGEPVAGSPSAEGRSSAVAVGAPVRTPEEVREALMKYRSGMSRATGGSDS